MDSYPVLIVLAIAVAAPLLAEIPVGVRLPVVVLEMVRHHHWSASAGFGAGPGVARLAGGSSGWRLCSSWRGWNSISNGFGAAL